MLRNDKASKYTLCRSGIVQSVSRLVKGWKTEGSEFDSWWEQESSLLHNVQTGSGAHPVSYPMGPGVLSADIKQPGREAYHSTETSAEVKKSVGL
jgi:hypothetical protein